VNRYGKDLVNAKYTIQYVRVKIKECLTRWS
jgi:hypothetical protein